MACKEQRKEGWQESAKVFDSEPSLAWASLTEVQKQLEREAEKWYSSLNEGRKAKPGRNTLPMSVQLPRARGGRRRMIGDPVLCPVGGSRCCSVGSDARSDARSDAHSDARSDAPACAAIWEANARSQSGRWGWYADHPAWCPREYAGAGFSAFPSLTKKPVFRLVAGSTYWAVLAVCLRSPTMK